MELISFQGIYCIFEDLIGDKVWWDSGLAGGAESEQWLGSQGRFKGHCLAIANWLLCLFICTFPAPLVSRGLNAAQLPPTPWGCPNLPFLFFSPRSSSVIDLCSDCLGSRQPGRTQEVGLGSCRNKTYSTSVVMSDAPSQVVKFVHEKTTTKSFSVLEWMDARWLPLLMQSFSAFAQMSWFSLNR